MRASILGFNQQALLDYPYGTIKMEDVLLLNYIWNAAPSPSLQHIIRDGRSYVWLKHDKILEDLPILNISADRLKRRMQRLLDLQLIEKVTVSNDNVRGTKVYYGLTINAENLLYSGPGVENNTWSEDQVLETTPENTRPGVENNTSNNKLNLNNKLKNKNNNKESALNHHSLKKAPSVFDQCVKEINEFTKDPDVRNALMDYLKMRIKKQALSVNGWKGILKKFKDRVKESDYITAIHYSTKMKFLGIFNEERKTIKSKTSDSVPAYVNEGIPHDGRYNNENHHQTALAF